MLFIEILKSLPVPTLEQTARFADHVADNHSWYKHLPFFPPGASFVCFPNPHAGRVVNVEGNRFAACGINNGDYFSHHSRLSTAEYVNQLGYWDYWVDDNPRDSDHQRGPWLYSLDGRRRELLDDELKRRWSCRLTAFLNPAPPMFRLRASDLERERALFMARAGSTAAGGRPVDRFLRRLFGRRGEVPMEGAVVDRYRAVAERLRRATGSMVDPALIPFMESEAQALRQLLLDTLDRVRTAWTEAQTGPSQTAPAPDSARM